VTLKNELDLNIMKVYLHTDIEPSMSRHLKVKELQTDSTQADAMHCYATFVGDKNT